MKLLQGSAWDVLPHNECVLGLRSLQIGRIALSADALPVILPVYFVYDGSAIVFRTRAGSVIDRNCRNTVVAFEVDSHDAGRRTGWSVMAVGVANVLAADDRAREQSVRLDRIGAPDGDVLIGIELGTVSGRALAHEPSLVVSED
ncbi:MAG TPA: pyridoxamine 5'-phosphate oxidase family protein [Mycobacteriales bacterium]|nr:pyridoxamine 5'-phosphate oxidase family protein [Mycobacteriales bacterium]